MDTLKAQFLKLCVEMKLKKWVSSKKLYVKILPERIQRLGEVFSEVLSNNQTIKDEVVTVEIKTPNQYVS